MSDRPGGLEVVWPGKYDQAGQRVEIPPSGARLQPWARYGEGERGHIVLGDNLLAMDALLQRGEGTVDLCYIDPPFATGNTFDLVTRVGDGAGRIPELRTTAYLDTWEGGLSGFMAMLDARLRRIHRLLAPHGSLYVHVDPTVGHAVKLLLDEIFGPECFQREIVWRIGWVSGFKTRARNWIRNHDDIYFYTKDPRAFTFNKHYVPHPPDYRRRDGSLPRGKGMPMEDVWNANESEFSLRGAQSLDSIQIKSFSTEKSGWATQKNESLVRRIVEASSNPGDLVLDAFCGSGTTLVAAGRTGRRFVGCDVSPAAVHIARKRLLELGSGVEISVVGDRDRSPPRAAPAFEVALERDDAGYRLVLSRYRYRHPDTLPDGIREQLHPDRPWSELVDAWDVDLERGEVFVAHRSAFRTYARRELRLEARLPDPLPRRVEVRVVDVLGYESRGVFELDGAVPVARPVAEPGAAA